MLDGRQSRADGRVHGILPVWRTRESCVRQDVRFRIPDGARNVADDERVVGERSGLIDAQDVDRRRVLKRREPSQEDTVLRERLCADGGGERERGRQRDRHRREQRREDERHDARWSHVDPARIRDHSHDDDGVDHREVAYDVDHRSLFGAFDMRRLDEFDGAPEIRLCAGRGHPSRGFASTYKASCVECVPGTSLDDRRLAGERRLVDEGRAKNSDDLEVGGHDVPQRDLDGVARYEVGGGHELPLTVPPHLGLEGKPLLEKLQRHIRPRFLKEAETRVEQQQQRDHHGL